MEDSSQTWKLYLPKLAVSGFNYWKFEGKKNKGDCYKIIKYQRFISYKNK